MHLTDHPALAPSLLNTYHVDDVIEEAVCFEKDAVPIMSLKPSIVQVPVRSFFLGLENYSLYQQGRIHKTSYDNVNHFEVRVL